MLCLFLWSAPQIQVHSVIILWSFHWFLHVLHSKKSQKCTFPSSSAPVSWTNLGVSWLILTSSIKLAWHEPCKIPTSSIITQTVIFYYFILNQAFASKMLNIFHGYSNHFKITARLKNLFLSCSISNCYLHQFIHFGCQLSDLLAKYLHTRIAPMITITSTHW